MFFFFPLLLILFAAIFVKNGLPLIFKFIGWPKGGTLVLEDRVGALLFLLCSAIIAGIAYWYPWYLVTYYAAPDDRYGFAILFAFPFYFVGAAIAGVALYRLLKSVIKGRSCIVNGVFAVCGVLLALLGLSPLLMLGWRILVR